jgi:hypothetical protein
MPHILALEKLMKVRIVLDGSGFLLSLVPQANQLVHSPMEGF